MVSGSSGTEKRKMNKTTIQTQTKAPVEVVMPEIKLTVADLAYMTGLLPGGTRCSGAHKVTDKLTFLGLIEYREIQPCQKLIAEWKAKVEAWKQRTRLAVREKRWEDIDCLSYSLRKMPSVTKDYGLTKSGLEFLSKGRAKSVTAVKGSCL